MKDKLRWLHRWIGIPLGIMFFITLCTGAIVAYFNVKVSVDDRGYTFRETTVAEDAAAINFLKQEFPAADSVYLPTERLPFYRGGAMGNYGYTSIADENGQSHVIQDLGNLKGPVYTWILDLHRYYKLGRGNDNPILGFGGDHVTAWMSLFAVVVSLIGVYLWWPFRSKYKIKQAVPMSNKRRAYFNAHLTSGLIVVGGIVIWGLSGAGIQYRAVATSVLGAGGDQTVGLLDRPEPVASDMESWILAAQAKMPDGKLIQLSYPRGARGGPPGAAQGGAAPGGQQGGAAMGPPPGGQQRGAMGAPPGGQQGGAMGGPPGGQLQGALQQALGFRFVTDDDWLSVPNSYVYINQANSEIVGLKRFGDNKLGSKLFAMMNPLHTGNNINFAYVVIMGLMAALAAIMIFSGVISMFWNLLKKKREKGSIVVVSKGEGDKTAVVTIEAPGGVEGAPAE